MCCVTQHTRTHKGAQAPNQQDDLAAINEQLGVADDNCKILSRVPNQQRDPCKDYFNHEGALAGQDERI